MIKEPARGEPMQIKEPVNDKVPVKWYLRPLAILLAVLLAGPFAIPLIWISPAFKRWQRVVITVLIVLLTLWMIKSIADLMIILSKEWQNLQAALK